MLHAGTRLGPYEIRDPIGAGGMGEVYKARDTRLDRDVAIKVLPAHLADDPQFRERFDREAKSIAALNHPNICALHDIGDSDLTGGGPGTAGGGRVQFLVLEYLEGETLAARLGRGALTVREALAVAIQMADALDKAHRAGIVHRDLKPGNVFLVRSGGASAPPTAKLLDFGLAKTSGATPIVSAAEVTVSAAQAPLTARGTILGTFQYMSPEQIEGRDADARSDIFAFGVLLYEMVTGARAFTGKTTASVMAAILGAEPPALSSLQPLTPAALERVVRRCLEKDADDRWQTARDLLAELKWIADSSATTSDTARAVRETAGRERLVWAAAALVAAATVGGGVWLLTRPSPTAPTPVARFTIALPANAALTGFNRNVIALSRDGTSIVYVGQVAGAGGTQLYLRSLDRLEPTPVRGTEGASAPFFSSDGTAIGFMGGSAQSAARGQIRTVPLSGGGPLTLAGEVGLAGAVWSTDGRIYFASREAQGSRLHRIPSGGGPSVDITVPGLPAETLLQHPDLLPGEKTALVTLRRPGAIDASAIAVVTLDTGEQRTIIEGGFSPRYASSGHIVFGRAGALLAVPFDLKRLEVTGPATPVAEGVQTQTGVAQFAISTTGTLVYVPGRSTAALSALVWVDRRGNDTPIPGRPAEYQELALSPDGLRVAANEGFNTTAGGGSSGGDVWVHQVARGTATRFTFGPEANETPVWSRDGSKIAYASRKAGNTVFVKPSDGSAPEEKVGEKTDGHLHLESWSPRGDVMALVDTSGAGGGDIWLLRLAGQKFEAFLTTPVSERSPTFSPDGRWIAYVTNESGHDEVYVQAFPGPGGRWQVSVDGGVEPVWAPNGRELFYRNGEKLMAVPIESTTTSIGAGTPALLFEKRYVLSGVGRYYDVAPDGQRFVMLKPVATAGDSLIVVQGFTRELERLVPTKP